MQFLLHHPARDNRGLMCKQKLGRSGLSHSMKRSGRAGPGLNPAGLASEGEPRARGTVKIRQQSLSAAQDLDESIEVGNLDHKHNRLRERGIAGRRYRLYRDRLAARLVVDESYCLELRGPQERTIKFVDWAHVIANFHFEH